jgi:hypothetical protein
VALLATAPLYARALADAVLLGEEVVCVLGDLDTIDPPPPATARVHDRGSIGGDVDGR